MANKDIPIKILLDDDSDKKLNDLASLTETSRSNVIRELIRWRHAMQLKGTPTCANGHPCFVAHLHLIQTSQATLVHTVNEQEKSRLVGPPIAIGF